MHNNSFVGSSSVSECVTVQEYSEFIRDFVGHASGRSGLKAGIAAVSEQLNVPQIRVFNWFYNRIVRIDTREAEEYHIQKAKYLATKAAELEVRSKEAWDELRAFQRRIREAGNKYDSQTTSGSLERLDTNSDGIPVGRGPGSGSIDQSPAKSGHRR
jgi:hypothetical protein